MSPDDDILDPITHGRYLALYEEYQRYFTCEKCGAPTFFPHGGEEADDLRHTRRWLCKQCGYYVGPEGEAWALYDTYRDREGCSTRCGHRRMNAYNTEFFQLEGQVARQSAEVVLPWVLAETGARSVIDVGCGTGEWAAEAAKHGCATIGVDKYVPRELQTVKVINCDLINGYPCGVFDLAICLEVAEHLPEEAAIPLVAGLARARWVLFSAATPGQPGVGHINCRPHDYWHGLFAEHGKTAQFVGDQFTEPVADFYRRNMFLYR